MWRRILGFCVTANVFLSLLFFLAEAQEPIFYFLFIYALLALIGLFPLRRGKPTAGPAYFTILTGAFILMHFPFTPLGPEGSVCSRCDQVVVWIALFAWPLEFLICAALAWRGLAKEAVSGT